MPNWPRRLLGAGAVLDRDPHESVYAGLHLPPSPLAAGQLRRCRTSAKPSSCVQYAGPYYSRGVTSFEPAVHRGHRFRQFIRQENKVADAFICRGLGYLHLKDTVAPTNSTAIRTSREPQRLQPWGRSLHGAEALSKPGDFNKAIGSATRPAVMLQPGVGLRHTNRPMPGLSDFDKVIHRFSPTR